MVSTLQEKYPRILSFDWDLKLWGPEGESYGQNMLELWRDFYDGYYTLSPHEPTHHRYVWKGGYGTSIFEEALEKFVDDENFSDEDKVGFVSDAIIYSSHIQTPYLINNSLRLTNLDQKRGSKKQQLKWKNKLGLEFDEDSIRDIINIYRKWGIGCSDLNSNSTYQIKIPKKLADKYNYLDPANDGKFSPVDGSKIDFRVLPYLNKYGLLKDKEEMNNRLEEIREKEFNESKVEELKDEYNNEKYLVKELYSNTNEGGLKIKFEPDGTTFSISDSLKDRIYELSRKRDINVPSAHLYYYNALQPMELLHLLSKYGRSETTQKLTSG